MSFAKEFFLAILVLAPASRSAGRALESTLCFDEKVEACVRPGGRSFHWLPIPRESMRSMEIQ